MAGESKLMREVLRQLQAKAEVLSAPPSSKPSKPKPPKTKAATGGGPKQAAALGLKIANLLRKRAGMPPLSSPTSATPTPYGKPPGGPGKPPRPPSGPTGNGGPSGNGGPAPFARGPGQGITGTGFNYNFPEEGEAPPLPTAAKQGKLTGKPLGNLNLVGRLGRMTGDIRADQKIQDRQRGKGGSAAQSQGIVIAEEFRTPHTLRTKTGKHCRTDRWFDRCGLCYDSGLPETSPGGADHPMLWIGGTGFRCYYPRSTRSDFASMMSSGSTGRWLKAWSQRSSYVSF